MDAKQEKLIDSLIEHKKSLWTTLIILNGGIAGLILSFSPHIVSVSNLTKILLLIIGLFLNYLFLEGLFKISKKLTNALK